MKRKLHTCYMIFDSRYLIDEDSATCFSVCDTLKEAMAEKDDYGDNNVIVKSVGEEHTPRKISEISSEIVWPKK